MDKPMMRRIAGPLFAALIAGIAYGAATLGTAFDDSFRYSGATKQFVSALLSAIDRGDADVAHAELRKFDSISIETYEGDAFLKWLRDPVTRLSADVTMDVDDVTNTDVGNARSPASNGGEP